MRSSIYAVLLVLVSGVACKKEVAPAAEGTLATVDISKQPVEVKAASQTEPVAAAKSKYQEAAFDLEFAPKGTYKAGQAAEVEIVLVAKDPFHVNDKYPYKFKAKEAPGLTYKSAVFGKDAAKLETKRVTMPIGFTPAAKGKCNVGGQFSFSVCTDDKCVIEKRDLALEVTAE
jgi:hypothetical protein